MNDSNALIGELPRQARTLAVPEFLQQGKLSVFLHPLDTPGHGLLPAFTVQSPAVVPSMPILGFNGREYRSLSLPSHEAVSMPCLDDMPAAAWFNGAAAAFPWWKARQSDGDVDRILARGNVEIVAGQTISAPGLMLVRVLRGRLAILGMEGEELGEGALVAMPREMSLLAVEASTLEVRGMDDTEVPERLLGIQRLWLLSMKKAAAAAALADEKERQRGAEYAQRESADMELGIDALSGLVVGDTEWIAPKVETVAPLLAVARRIGAAMGVPFKKGVKDSGLSNAQSAAELAEVNGVRCRQVTLHGSWWKSDNGPLLAFRAGTEEPLALLPEFWRRGYVAIDAQGNKVHVDAAAAREIKPFAFVYYRPLPHKKLTEIDLLRFGLRGYEREMAGVVVLAGVIGALGLVVPLASAWLMDAIIPAAQKHLLVQLGLGLLCVTITVSLFSLVRSLMVLRIQDKMDMAIQAAVWDRLLRMPTSFHRRYSVANLESRARACQKIIRILSARTIASIFAGSFSALNFLVLFRFSVSLSVLALLLIVVAAGAVTWFRRRAVRIAIEAPDSPRNLNTLVLQLFQGLGKLRTAAAEGRAFGQWAREHALGEVPNVGLGKLRVAQNVFFYALDHLAVLILFGAAGFVLSQHSLDRLSAGEFVGFFAAFGGVFHGVLSLCATLVGTVAVSGAHHKARPILETLPEVEDGKAAPGVLTGLIEVNGLNFAYHDGPQVLTAVSFVVNPGEFVAIVGPSGSGKSTLVRALLGLEKASGGAVLYDDKEINELSMRQLRRQFGVVLQDTRLLAGDILSNIVGDSGASQEQAWQVAEAAAVADDIRALPMGMFTIIGEGASTLSAGQRQRILIARALMRRPPVLFLDEATSLLDGPAQARVMANLSRMRVSRIVIAHRLSALIDADQILVLDQGRIVEHGNFAELMAQGGVFRKMAADQLEEIDLQR